MNKFCDMSSRLTSAIQVQTIVAGEKIKKITTGRPVRGKKNVLIICRGTCICWLLSIPGLRLGLGIDRVWYVYSIIGSTSERGHLGRRKKGEWNKRANAPQKIEEEWWTDRRDEEARREETRAVDPGCTIGPGLLALLGNDSPYLVLFMTRDAALFPFQVHAKFTRRVCTHLSWLSAEQL